METYIALLRGINVSGQRKIRMVDLKVYLEELDIKNIQTYIQSGNVIFEYENATPEELEKKIEQKIFEKYGFEVIIFVKRLPEFKSVVTQNPFLQDPGKDISRLYVTFLSETLLSDHIEKLKSIDLGTEKFIIDRKMIYFFYPDGYGKSKLNNNFLENKLKLKATTRNWKTVTRLWELAITKGRPSNEQ